MKLLLALLVLTTFEVRAQNCRPDIKKFCSGVKPGEGLMMKCLHSNISNVSKACQKELSQSVSDVDKNNPCMEDLVDFCGDLPLDGEKMSFCLLKNERKISGECAQDFGKRKPNFLKGHPCGQETIEYCYEELKAPESRLTRCLVRNRKKAGPTCSKALEKVVKELKATNSCFDEIEKFCASETKPREIQTCLEKKKSSLTATCQAAVEKQAQKIKSHPCYQDLNTICKTALTVEKQMKCLEVNQEKLSPACKAHQKERGDKLRQMVTACEADRTRYCSKVSKKVGKVLSCLKKNRTRLSPACQNTLP